MCSEDKYYYQACGMLEMEVLWETICGHFLCVNETADLSQHSGLILKRDQVFRLPGWFLGYQGGFKVTKMVTRLPRTFFIILCFY